MARPHVYRVGDRVRIIRPKFIERIGYPVHYQSLVSKWADEYKAVQALKVLGLIPEEQHHVSRRVLLDFAEGCARAENRLNGFGGRERSIHYWAPVFGDNDHYIGQEYDVLAKRFARTGTYYAPHGGYYETDYGREYDYTNGGLESAKTHVILMLSAGDIEACDVEPVR